MAVRHAKPVHQMSEEELLALYTEFEALPRNGRQQWIKDRGYYDSTFYTLRKQWLAAHPEFQLSEASLAGIARSQQGIKARKKLIRAKVRQKRTVRSMIDEKREQMAHARAVLAEKRKKGLIKYKDNRSLVGRRQERPAFDFSSADDIAKRATLSAYRKLSLDEKAAFRERYNMTQAQVTRYNKLFFADDPVRLPAPPPDQDDTQRYLDEYLHLLGNGSKTEWLKRHGLNHGQIFEVKKRGRSIYTFKSFIPDDNRRSLVPARRAEIPIIDVQPIGTSQHVPSIDDAIAAFEVQRDQLNGFIEQLKRMRGGHR